MTNYIGHELHHFEQSYVRAQISRLCT